MTNNIYEFKVEDIYDKSRLDNWLYNCVLSEIEIEKEKENEIENEIENVSKNEIDNKTKNITKNKIEYEKLNLLKENLSRTLIQKWIKAGLVKLKSKNVKKLSSHSIIKKEDIYILEIDKILILDNEKESLIEKIQPVDLNFEILFEDDFFAIIHKPPNIAMHPGQKSKFDISEKNNEVTIVNGVLAKWNYWQKNFIKERIKNGVDKKIELEENYDYNFPGLVHRLDRETEGVLIIAKTLEAQSAFKNLFKTRKIKKTYIAWVWGGMLEEKGIINLPIKRDKNDRLKMQIVAESGREAITNYKTLTAINTPKGRKFSLLELNPLTGRTHQIRIHLAHNKCPVVGDRLYTKNKLDNKNFGLLLFAKSLKFLHPFTNKIMFFELEQPERFNNFEDACKFM